jgi:transmembrane sensor
MEISRRIRTLLDKFRSATINETEFDELLIWLHGLDEKQEAELAEMDQPLWDELKTKLLPDASRVDWEAMKNNILASDAEERSVKRIGWWRYAAAAILILGIGITWLVMKDTGNGAQQLSELRNTDSVLPNTNQTVLTLADGRTIILDSSNTGELLAANGVKVIKLQNGEIAYDGQSNTNLQPELHTITVPRGGRPYQIVMTDGSKIWLNAASSLKYPSFFSGKTREVEITGEAYFEVAHNAAKPFHVKYNQMDVQVLGTHFNVNTYDDEKDIRITLLEGSVKVNATLIKPGQQSIVPHNDPSLANTTVAEADLDLTTAWVKGLFHFDKADIKTILRQVARWYDLDIEFEGKVSNDLFSGKIERTLPLTGIVTLLSSSNIKVRVEGKKLIVE